MSATDLDSAKVELYPVQGGNRYAHGGRGQVNEAVYLRAYEVYCHVHGPQPAMIDREGRNCRGGFGKGELVAFLYASGFPCSEWKARTDEALRGMDI